MSSEHLGVETPKAARLAIAIPAYGRASAIANSITSMAQLALSESIDIVFYVSDDTPDSSVRDGLKPLINSGVPVFYRSNEPSLGHDQNLIATLLWPNADYVWLLGTANTVIPQQLSAVYQMLDTQDLIFVNRRHSDPDNSQISELRGQTAIERIRARLWRQTQTGLTIYGQSVREWAAQRPKRLLAFPDFPQVALILGYASEKKLVIGLFGQPALESSGAGSGSYWRNRAVDVFVYNWSRVVSSFPEVVPPKFRAQVIREHSARTDLFNTANLIYLREIGQLDWKSVTEKEFCMAMHLPMWKLHAVLVFPIPLLKACSSLLANAKRCRIKKSRKFR